ncbi:MAG: class I SAM-dependent methyltransferase, partial [Bacteroidota bacterium]
DPATVEAASGARGPLASAAQPLAPMREYDQIAEWYSRVRDPESGAADVEAFLQTLPPEARVLDLGCGDGVPVTRLLIEGGCEVVGLDSSAEMIARFQASFPEVDARHERAQEAVFEPESFHAVVAWGVLFHLSPEDQRDVIARVAGWLVSGGRFLFTSAEREGETESEMDGVTFPYISLGENGYREALHRAGLRLERATTNAWDNHVYVAHKLA